MVPDSLDDTLAAQLSSTHRLTFESNEGSASSQQPGLCSRSLEARGEVTGVMERLAIHQ